MNNEPENVSQQENIQIDLHKRNEIGYYGFDKFIDIRLLISTFILNGPLKSSRGEYDIENSVWVEFMIVERYPTRNLITTFRGIANYYLFDFAEMDYNSENYTHITYTAMNDSERCEIKFT